MDWSKLLCETRFAEVVRRPEPTGCPPGPKFDREEFRIQAERDHDRILFSTPLRRMGDKTQVFPLESIESIRTRLTHSYEVANLSRSVGLELAERLGDRIDKKAHRKLPAILAATGLAHDIGNPPFGHQSEGAIRAWFDRNQSRLWGAELCKAQNQEEIAADVKRLSTQHKQDFLKFEGNAQTLRVLARLQVVADDLGLNLTVGTLAALMKYVAPSDACDESKPARKKVGFFASEATAVGTIREMTGLEGDARHPLALVMEACDDIAYSVLDAEDAIKKGLVSFNDLIAWLKRASDNDEFLSSICKYAAWQHDEFAKQKLHPNELDDVSTQMFRVRAIHWMIGAVVEIFVTNFDAITNGEFADDLIAVSRTARLCRELKRFDRENAFAHRSVLEIELHGFNIINRLMDYLWIGITHREKYDDPASARATPFSRYVYSRISRNYRRVFEEDLTMYQQCDKLPIRYREMQLLTDMISGMTDRFCFDLLQDLEAHHVEMRRING